MNGELLGLAVQGLLRKKRSSLLLFAVLLLSFAFAIISPTVTDSIRRTNEEYRWDTYGIWYGAIRNGRGSDEEFLRDQEWLDKLGTCVSYGNIQVNYSSGASIGTMDEAFLEIGRIVLQDGRFPENANEIAMEADLLSALGYDYTLGQEITVTIDIAAEDYEQGTGGIGGSAAQSVTMPVERTFTLCGVIREYTNLWTQGSSSFKKQPLNSAMVTLEAAEALCQSAKDAAAEWIVDWGEAPEKDGADQQVVGIVLEELVPQYYFSVLSGFETEAREQTNKYLLSTRRENGTITGDFQITVNTFAFSSNEQEGDIEVFFIAVILAVTLLSVVCIYAIRIQDEARQLATFRSIGITRRQLCVMLIYETVCLGVPAMLLGAGAGALGTWVLLRLAMYSGSVAVHVVIPPALLAAAAALWLLGILAARLAVFLVALRAPLTGRFHVARKKARRYRNLQRILIGGLSALLCTAVIFTVLESLEPIRTIRYMNTLADYTVTRKADKYPYNANSFFWFSAAESNWEFYFERDFTVPKEAAAPLSEVPGVTRAWGWGQEYVRLDFDGIEDVPLAAGIRQRIANETTAEYSKLKLPYGIGPFDPDALPVYLAVVDEGDWEGIIDFDINMDQFRSGNAVLLSFCLSVNGKYVVDSGYTTVSKKEYEETGLSVGDTIRITAGTPMVYGTVETQVGGIITYTPTADTGGLWAVNSSYTIICSETFLEKLLDAIGPDEAWNEFRQGTPYGYEQVSVFVDRNADYLSTDAVLAELCTRENLQLDASRREMKQKWIQEETQTLLLLVPGGGCVALVLLLILGNTLSMEAERQKRNFGILQALGMSKRQFRRKQLAATLGRGVLGTLAGWLAYSGYCVVYALREQGRQLLETGRPHTIQMILAEKFNPITLFYGNWQVILPLTAVCIGLILAVSWLAKRRLTRDDLMAKLRDEH